MLTFFLFVLCIFEAWLIYVIATWKFEDFQRQTSKLPPKGSLDN